MSCNIIFHTENLTNQSKEEKGKKALKLHLQFAHATKEKLIQLLKNGVSLSKTVTCCVVSAERFNQMVAMDLKEVTNGKLWILHLVDCAT